jgi:RHH-type proline utilization regulon transcriptional repressor/proline dehydrogenase/delta 1-pyrroline-5-carboxylate dehydrogenase
VAEAIDFCDFYAAEMRVLGKSAKMQIMAGETNVQHWWPRGVGVVTSPWNFPLAILCGMACAAVAGDHIVPQKASNETLAGTHAGGTPALSNGGLTECCSLRPGSLVSGNPP